MQKIRIGCFAVIVFVGIAGYFLSSYFASIVPFCFSIIAICILGFFGYLLSTVIQVGELEIRPVPKSLQESHEALLAFGFEPFGSMRVKEIFNISYLVWAYLSEDGYTHAYIGGLEGGTWFSSYFGKGFDLTTRYQNGPHTSNGKLESQQEVVTSSLQAALSHHLYRVENYANQWGNPIIFASLQEQVNWEKQYKAREAQNYILLKQFLMGVGFVLGMVIIQLLCWLFIYTNEAISPEIKVFVFLLALLALFAPLVFAFMSFARSRTVEARKKKKLDEKEKPLA
jgi:hypothetical protein